MIETIEPLAAHSNLPIREVEDPRERALDRIFEAHPRGRVAIATHRNLLTLYLDALCRDVGFELWRSLELPDVHAVSPSGAGESASERIAGSATQRGAAPGMVPSISKRSLLIAAREARVTERDAAVDATKFAPIAP